MKRRFDIYYFGAALIEIYKLRKLPSVTSNELTSMTSEAI